MDNQYDDIINHPHHVSRNHPQMSMRNRAAQFSPFAALTGYEETISETARLTTPRCELDEQEKTELNRKLLELQARLNEQPEVELHYFVPDQRKNGGACEMVSGIIKEISTTKKTISLQDGTIIKMNDLLAIQYKDRK